MFAFKHCTDGIIGKAVFNQEVSVISDFKDYDSAASACAEKRRRFIEEHPLKPEVSGTDTDFTVVTDREGYRTTERFWIEEAGS